MSLFGGLGGGGGTGIIGQTLGLARSTTVAPQIVPSAPVNSQNSNTAATFGVAVQNQINSIGYQFKPCLPPNQTVAQKVLNNKSTEVASYLCCITGIDQFQQTSIFELALNDRRIARQGGVQNPQGNLNQIGIGLTQQNSQTGAQNLTGGGGALFGGQPAAGGMFGGPQNTTGGMFGAQTAPNTVATGGLFGGQPSVAPTLGGGGGLFGNNPQAQGGALQGTNPSFATGGGGGGLFGANPTPATGGGLFGANPAPATGGGLFGANQTPAAGGGLFGTNTAPATGGGLFGANQTQATGGSLFGATQNTGILGGGLNNQNQGGMFGNAGQTGGGLFGQKPPQQQGGGLFGQQPQQQQMNQQNYSQNELIEEIRRIEQAKAFSQNQKKEEEEGMKNRKFADKNHINHINYLKSQQQKRNVLQQYTIQNKNVNKFIEAPYTVKVNVSWENVKRSEWQLLQRSQNIKNQAYLNMGGEQRTFYPNQNYNNNSLFYNQLRQLERTSYQYTNKSIAIKEKEFQKEQLETFSQTSYFKRMEPIISKQVDEERMQQNPDFVEENDSEIIKQKENSIQYLYDQSLKKNIKQFNTTVTIRIFEDQDELVIPLQVKSSNTVSYLLMLVFDYLEDNYNLNPEKLDIYHSNYVLYQPVEIEHLLQVRKDSLISQIETSQSGKIGNFEIVWLDPSDPDVENIKDEEEEFMDEEEDEQSNFGNINQDFDYLPIIPEGYYTIPHLKELIGKTRNQLSCFQNFKIGNQFAEICFEAEIDLIRRDFSKELLINESEVIIYPYQQENEPPVKPGYGINVQATIKRFNAQKIFFQNEKFDIQKIERRIRKLANDYKMEIVEPYNAKTDSFTVRVFKFNNV